jgi:hypothetical protein
VLRTRRPWWDRIAFAVALIFGGQGTYWYLSQHRSLGIGLASRYLAGLLLACSQRGAR